MAANLDALPHLVWEELIKYCTFQDKKNLRLVNWSLYHRIQERKLMSSRQVKNCVKKNV